MHHHQQQQRQYYANQVACDVFFCRGEQECRLPGLTVLKKSAHCISVTKAILFPPEWLTVKEDYKHFASEIVF